MTAITSDVPQLLTGLSTQTPGRKCFITGAVTVTYRDFRKQVAQTRRFFRERNVKLGERIVIASADDVATAALYTACLLDGVTAVVIDPAASSAEATVLVDKARASLIFADTALIDGTDTLRKSRATPIVPIAGPVPVRTSFGLLRRRGHSDGAETYPAVVAELTPHVGTDTVPADGVALILFTSGTTSRPKGVEITQANIAAQLRTFRRHYGYGADSVIVNHLPLHHTDGLNQGPLLTLATGGTLVRPGPVTLQRLGGMMDMIYRENGTHLITVPTVLAMMSRLPREYDDVLATPHFRFIASTAGYLDARIWREIEDRFKTKVVNSYGLTETVMEALYCGPTEETRQVGTIGKPIDCQARIVDDDGNDVVDSETGELWLLGENIMRGYFDEPEFTNEVLRDGWLRTGDLATRDDDGFFRIVGRKKNVIIRAGLNVYPEDVNSALLANDAIHAAATIGIEDDMLGESVVSCVVASDSVEVPTPEALIVECRKLLGPERMPNQILLVDELPLGPSGKVELAKLRATVMSRLCEGGAAQHGDVTVGQRVLAVAARSFNEPVNQLTPDASEESIRGWDSLSYLEFIMALERHFDLKLAPRDVMNIRRLGDAVRIVEERQG